MMGSLLALIARGWPLVRPYLWWIGGAAVLLIAALWLRHAGYEAGRQACQEQAAAARDAALAEAGAAYRAELAKRDAALAEAQGQVVEVVRWRTRVQTVYQEAVKNDPDCAEWAVAPIRCPVGLPVVAAPGAGGGAGVPADPGQPDG
jgi:hypothetical protein